MASNDVMVAITRLPDRGRGRTARAARSWDRGHGDPPVAINLTQVARISRVCFRHSISCGTFTDGRTKSGIKGVFVISLGQSEAYL